MGRFITVVLLVSAWAGTVSGLDQVEAARPATQWTYEMKYQSRGYVDMKGVVGANSGVATSGDISSRQDIVSTASGAEVIILLDRVAPSGIRASLQFQKVVVGIQASGQPQPDLQQRTTADLGKTVYFTMDATGKVLRIEFPGTYSTIARNMVRDMLAAQQFSLPVDRTIVKSWRTQEMGAHGRFSAQYALVGSAGAVSKVSKTVLPGPVRPSGPEGNPSRTEPTGKVDFSINAGGEIQLVQAAIHEAVTIQDRSVGANEISFHLKLAASSVLPDAALASARNSFNSVRASLSSALREELAASAEGEGAVHKQILGAETLETLGQALASLDARGGTNEEKTRLYLKVKALVFVHPGSSKQFGKILSTADLQNPSAALIAGALASVGSVEAQEALCGAIAARSNDAASLTALVPALGSLTQPTARTVSFLEDLARTSKIPEGRAASILALGSAAGNLSKVSAARSNRIVQELTAMWTPGYDKMILLLALGNTASSNAKTFILARRADASPGVRRAAATALSSFRAADSDLALTAMLKTDIDVSVRSAAAQSLTARSGVATVKSALLTSAERDKDETVRIASMFAVVNLIPKDKSVADAVSRIAREDAAKSVREQAVQLLEQAKPGDGAKASK